MKVKELELIIRMVAMVIEAHMLCMMEDLIKFGSHGKRLRYFFIILNWQVLMGILYHWCFLFLKT